MARLEAEGAGGDGGAEEAGGEDLQSTMNHEQSTNDIRRMT